MQGIALVLVMAVITEGIVEYVKSLYNMFAKDGVKTAVLQAIAIVVSIAICFATSANLFATLGIMFKYEWIGTLLTGIFASRGANYVSDLVSKLSNNVRE